MSLQDQIDKKRKEIKTDGYPMSIGEWMNMYEKDELDIHPEFQRYYRWSEEQKTSLIESILLGIPLPPIFVSQRSDGVWDVVDGLQRLSTIFQFVGILKDEQQQTMPPLVLQSTKYLPALKGIEWENMEKPKHGISKDLQLVIKRSKISASIILKESDETAKYDLFQRLNTGGSELSPQEVRNCLLMMLNKPMFEWLKSLPNAETFVTTTALSDRLVDEAYDVELALRFVILAQIDEAAIKSIGDVGIFLTDRMTEIAQDRKFKKPPMQTLLSQTFELIDEVMGDEAFKRYSLQKQRHEGGFLLSQFEVVALGIAFNLANGTLCAKAKLRNKIRSIWSDKDFTDWATSGVTAARRLPRLIPYGRKLFKK